MNLFRQKISNNSDFQIHYKLNKAKYKSTYNALFCEIRGTNINICFYLFIFKNKDRPKPGSWGVFRWKKTELLVTLL